MRIITIRYSAVMLALLAGVATQSALATSTSAHDTPSVSQKSYLQVSPIVATLSVGPAWYNAGETQTFYLLPGVEKTYDANKQTRDLATGEFFLGIQRQLNERFQGQLGFAVETTSNAKLTGSIWEYADPEFDNYIYSYKVNHTSVAVKGKILADVHKPVTPYISGSLGVGFNYAHAFERTAVVLGEIPHPPFASNRETAFTYTVGIGVQRELNKNWQVGIGYEFADWGQSHLDRFAGQTLNTGLSLNHLYTNELQFSLSYTA